MTASAAPRTASTRSAGVGRTALLLLAATVVASVANLLVAAAAILAGADPAFPALGAVAVIPSTLIGILIGYVGWRLAVRIFPHSATALRIIVPIAVVLSWTPDLILLATGFIPGATLTGVIGLMIMHPVLAAVGVPVYARLAPARA